MGYRPALTAILKPVCTGLVFLDSKTVNIGEDIYLSGLKGTPAWMAPEVLSGESVSTSTDIYGLGMILWEMSSAEKPFEGKTVKEVRTDEK